MVIRAAFGFDISIQSKKDTERENISFYRLPADENLKPK